MMLTAPFTAASYNSLDSKLAADDAGAYDDDDDDDAAEAQEAFVERVRQAQVDHANSLTKSKGRSSRRSSPVKSSKNPVPSVSAPTAAVATPLPPLSAPASTTPPARSLAVTAAINNAASAGALPALPFSRPNVSRKTSTPTAPRIDLTLQFGTAPTVSTPSMPPKLPPPPQVTAAGAATPAFDSPANVPTPTQTPGAVGTVRRDDPATPIAVGKDVIDRFQPKELQKLSKLRDAFDLSKAAGLGGASETSVTARGRGRGRGRASAMSTRTASRAIGIGAGLFKGLRICLAVNRGEVSKQETRCQAITNRGGAVVFQPDTAITHVIYDGPSESTLNHVLGIGSLSELPQGTMCVKYSWVQTCITAGTLVEPTHAFLSFPPTVFTRPGPNLTLVSRFSAASRSSGKRRGRASSDSEEESSERHVRPRVAPHAERARNDRMQRGTADVSTRHEVATGPGWVQPAPGVERDGLDLAMMSIQNDDVESDYATSEGEADEVEEDEQPGNPNRRADTYKCGQKHTGETTGKGPNEDLALMFEKYHRLYEGQLGKNDFSKLGYRRGEGRAKEAANTLAAGIMRNCLYPIKSAKQARKLRGIGPGMADRIDEYLTGIRGRMDYENTPEARAIASFKDVYGIGQKLAHDLWANGARSIHDLRTKEFGLTAGQKIGLDLYDDLIERIPRDECREIFETVKVAAKAIDYKLWIEIMGSYRRGQANSGDVDILITRNDSDGLTHAGVIEKLVRHLKRKGFITHDLSTPHDWDEEEAKWMGVCRLTGEHRYRRLDILCIPFKWWGAALLYFTGNDIFNRSMRLYARKNGYSLNQRGLYTGVVRDPKTKLKVTEGRIIASRTEEEIFEALGIRWRPPHERRP